MSANLYKYLLIIMFTGIKFIFGPTMSRGLELSYWEAVFCTTVGMMLYITVVSFAGKQVKSYIQNKSTQGKKKPLFTPRNRWKVRFWRKYGLIGTALATPLILTPIGGTMLALSFGEKPIRIVLFMFISAIFWSIVLCFGIYLFTI